jgi:hypothetical protein
MSAAARQMLAASRAALLQAAREMVAAQEEKALGTDVLLTRARLILAAKGFVGAERAARDTDPAPPLAMGRAGQVVRGPERVRR